MTPSRQRFTLKHAVGLSTVLHALLAPLFLITGALMLGAGSSFEAIELHSDDRVPMTTVTIMRHTSSRAVAHHRERVPVSVAVASHPRSKLSKQAARMVRTGGQPKTVASTGDEKKSPASVPPARAVVAASTTPAPQHSDAAPAVQTTTAPVAVTLTSDVPARSGVDVPSGGWGQSFEHPLIADDSALNDLRAKYHFSAAITINVDENGHCVKITFPPAVPDDARDEIQKRLAALRYIPAECNGLRCAAPLSVTL